MEEVDTARVLAQVVDGDAQAWSTLVRRHGQTVWTATAGFRFDEHTRHDITQTVWLKLHDHAASIKDPARLAGWLARVAHNECITVIRRRRKMVLVDDRIDFTDEYASDPIDADVGADDERAALRRALIELDERCRVLLLLLAQDPPPSYDELSNTLDIPRGSLGPTRSRCLKKLAGSSELSEYRRWWEGSDV